MLKGFDVACRDDEDGVSHVVLDISKSLFPHNGIVITAMVVRVFLLILFIVDIKFSSGKALHPSKLPKTRASLVKLVVPCTLGDTNFSI